MKEMARTTLASLEQKTEVSYKANCRKEISTCIKLTPFPKRHSKQAYSMNRDIRHNYTSKDAGSKLEIRLDNSTNF